MVGAGGQAGLSAAPKLGRALSPATSHGKSILGVFVSVTKA